MLILMKMSEKLSLAVLEVGGKPLRYSELACL